MHTYRLTALCDCKVSGEIHLGLVPGLRDGRPEAIIERGIVTLKAGESKTLHMSLESVSANTAIPAHRYLKPASDPATAFFIDHERWPDRVVFAGLLEIDRAAE